MQITTAIQVRSKYLICYPVIERRENNRNDYSRASFNLKEAREKAYQGSMTKGAKKRLQKAITLMMQSNPEKTIFNPVNQRRQKFKISFITLTIHSPNSNITAKEANRTMMKPFIQWLQRRHNVNMYIWKAELQKRGQIHYHVITPNFIDCIEIRNKWNYLQRKNGYLKEYAKEHGNYNANSTDIHSMKKIKNVEAYLMKYLSKEEPEKGQTKGKIWDCSYNLKKSKYYELTTNAQIEANIKYLKSKFPTCYFETEFCTIIETYPYKPENFIPLKNQMEMKMYMEEIKNLTKKPKAKSQKVKPEPIKIKSLNYNYP